MSKANLTSLMGSESLGTLPALTMLGAEHEFENNSAAACAWYAYFKQFEIKPATMLTLAEV